MDLKIRSGVQVERAEAEAYLSKLKAYVGRRLELHIHRNSSALMRFERSLFKTRLFIHEAFVKAPEEIGEALGRFVKSSARDHAASSILNGFVETIETKKDLRPLELLKVGKVHNLEEAYARIHLEYFDNALDVAGITWFSTPVRKRRAITLGQFDSARRLVKINRVLDSEKCPTFFVDFVVFHELLHAKIPPVFDEKRRRRVIHGSDFRRAEKDFAFYKEAKAWQKEHFGAQIDKWI